MTLYTHTHAHTYSELHQILLLYNQNPNVKHSEHCNINTQVTVMEATLSQ